MSHFTSPLTRQSHFTSPLTRQSHFTSALTRQSHFTSPLTRQSHFTSQLTRQSSPWLPRLQSAPSRLWFSPRKLFWGGHLPTGPQSPQIRQGRPSPLIHQGCPGSPDLPWPPELPASVPETKYALSASCVSVSSRSQSLPGISAPPWWPPVPSAPPWWAPVSSATQGPGPPFHLRSTAHLYCSVFRSVWKPLFGEGLCQKSSWHRLTTRGHPLTTLSLAPHYCCTSPTDCISHPPLH